MDSIPSQPVPAETTTPLVRVRDLTLSLPSASGRVNILRGVDLDIAHGEALGLVGPSGSGKTSLLMLLAGLERATGGSIEMGGEIVTSMDEDSLARMRRSRVGIVFQAFHLIPTMTALENVAVPLELAGRRDAEPVAAAALRAVGLGHRLTHLPSRLSGGEQQRVAVARAFAPEPDLLLADEPTGNLDLATGAAVMDLLFSLRSRLGTTLMLITHDTLLAARCDRQVRLADGKVDDGLLARGGAPGTEAKDTANEAKVAGSLGVGSRGAGSLGAGNVGGGNVGAGNDGAGSIGGDRNAPDGGIAGTTG